MKVVYAILFAVWLLLMFFLPKPKDVVETISNIKSIHMHEPGHWSVWVEDPATGIRTRQDVTANCSCRPPETYIPDVKGSNSMWAEVTRNRGAMQKIIFHTRSDTDIEGAGWNHGKFGKGQTVVVK